MKKCYTTIQIVVLLFLNSSANGSATTNEDYICNGELCIPKGYDPLDSPINGERDTAFGKSKVTWVYFNFIDKNDLAKKVDDQKMMITFQAVAIMIWNDPRLKIKLKIHTKNYFYPQLPTREDIWIAIFKMWHFLKKIAEFYSLRVTIL